MNVGHIVRERLDDGAGEHFGHVGGPDEAGAVGGVVRDEDLVVAALGVGGEIELVLPGGLICGLVSKRSERIGVLAAVTFTTRPTCSVPVELNMIGYLKCAQ